MLSVQKKRAMRDMTEGPILRQLFLYALPLIGADIFQLLYSTVDSLVVGNFVSVQALAAVGSASTVTGILLYFFSGFSTGATIIVGRSIGAKDAKRIHQVVETTMAITFLFCVVFTVLGFFATEPILRMISTPEDVIGDAAIYLKIYFLGISGLLIFNIGNGILRAVGDTVRPLLFLVFSCVVNIVLDLLFVPVFHMGIMGVAIATVTAELLSALALLYLLTTTKEAYRFDWRDLRLDPATAKEILRIGLPASIQSIITAISNTFIQGYINVFGSACMAGWSCFGSLSNIIALPLNSLSHAVTTFVSQNIGARRYDRVKKGIRCSCLVGIGIAAVLCSVLFVFAAPAVGIFNKDPGVLSYAVPFIRINIYSYVIGCLSHILSGALRSLGDSKNVMYLKIGFFVVLRQVYLFVMTRYILNTPITVSLSMSMCWILGAAAEYLYYRIRWVGRLDGRKEAL